MEEQEQHIDKKHKKLLILGYVNIAISVVILILIWNISGLVAPLEALQGDVIQQPSGSPTTTGNNQRVTVSVDDDPVLGDQNAPVTIIEFSDFECPFCGRFFSNTLPQLTREYIDTGKVKLVYRDFPLSFHPNAQKAAEAGECADDQGKFWEMHDKIFENQKAMSVVDLKSYAASLGLDTSEFNSCLDSGKHAKEIQKDISDGSKYGASGTPTFFINGIKLVGAQPFSAFQQIIESEL